MAYTIEKDMFCDIVMHSNHPLNIAIAGSSCSGKSTICREIMNTLGENNVCVIPQDNYFLNIEDIPCNEHGQKILDSISAIDIEKYKIDSLKILSGEKVEIPEYDFKIHKRKECTKEITPRLLNLFEGQHVLNILKEIPNLIRVFVDTPEEERIRRRCQREYEKYEKPHEETAAYWQQRMHDVIEKEVMPQKDICDIIVIT